MLKDRFKSLVAAFVCLLMLCSILPLDRVSAEEIVGEVVVNINNSGFEEDTVDGKIPGWKFYWSPLTSGYSIEATDTFKYSGNRSLKLDDGGSKSLGLSSDFFSVIPGKTYGLSTMAYLEKGMGAAYIRFYDSLNKEITAATVRAVISSPTGKWTRLLTEGVAPENAVKADIFLYSGASAISVLYFDNVKVEVKESLDMPFQFGSKKTWGPATVVSKTQGAVIGNNEAYFATNGPPATFYAIDAFTGEVKFSQQIAEIDIVWAITTAPDGNVYFASSKATNGNLYRYLPNEKRIENLGRNPSNNCVWDLDASNDGKIYGATYAANTEGSKVFEYDIASSTFRDLGVIYPGQQYARGLGVTDQYVYVGIGSIAHLIRVDRVTGEKKEINLPVTGQNNMVSNIWVYNGKLFVAYGTSLCILDEQTEQVIRETKWNDIATFDGMLSSPSPYNPDIIYFRHKNAFELWTYNTATDQMSPVEPKITLPANADVVKAFKWITIPDGEKAGRKVLAMVFNTTRNAIYDPQDNSYEMMESAVAKQGVYMQSLETGPDGKLYMGGYQAAMSIFDPAKKVFEVQAPQPEQIEGIGVLNGKVYFGLYGGAVISRYDTSQPYDAKNNPCVFYDIQEEQSRPFAFASGDNKLFVGTISDYGKLGGALSIYDEEKGTWEVHRNVVQDQSIMGVAYKDGMVYGGTTIWGGLGIEPTATEAKVFAWDVATGTKIWEIGPAVSGMDRATKIGQLSFGPDGLLWGIMNGYSTDGEQIFALFAMDPSTKGIVKSKLYYDGIQASYWRPYYLKWGPDGLLYTTIGRQLVVFDPDSLAYKKLVPEYVNLMTLANDGSIYYSTGLDANLYQLPVPMKEVSISLQNATMQRTETASLNITGILANGCNAYLDGAVIEYYSSNPEVADVENGTLTAYNTGSTDIYIKLTLDGVTFQSNVITVNVVTSIQSLSNLIGLYEKSGGISGPLVPQLSNCLNQAEHQLNKGEKDKAVKHIEDFLKHLNNKAMEQYIVQTSKVILNKDAEVLIDMWKNS